jgi:glucose-1-phosphate cytidylyltransferase
MSDVTFDMTSNRMEVHQNSAEPWRVTLVDTGENTQTGGRLRRVSDHLRGEAEFCFTYGDGVADIDIGASLAFHRAHGRLATVTGVQPPGRFGALDLDGDRVNSFIEKPQGDGAWINGGFFVLSPKTIELIEDDAGIWERDAMGRLSAAGELRVYKHTGFWQPMDTLRDRNHLEDLWRSGKAPWKRW